MEEQRNTEAKSVKTRIIILTAAVIVALSWGAFFGYYYVCFGGLPTTEQDAGNFGSMFGALNAFLSGGALIGAIIAIYLQREELMLTRREVIAQTRALQLQSEALEKQHRSMEQTRLEMQFQRNLTVLNNQLEAYRNVPAENKSKLRRILANQSSLPLSLKMQGPEAITDVLFDTLITIDALHGVLQMGKYIVQQKELQAGSPHLVELTKNLVKSAVGSEIGNYLDASGEVVLENLRAGYLKNKRINEKLVSAVEAYIELFSNP